MIKLLEDLLIEATTNPNVPGSLVAGLRKAVDTARAACGLLPPPFDSQEEAQRAASIWPQEAEPATVRVPSSAQHLQAEVDAMAKKIVASVEESSVGPRAYRVCVREHGTCMVGDVVEDFPQRQFSNPDFWAPCDKDGWVSATISWPVGMKVEVHDPYGLQHLPGQWRPARTPKPSAIDEMAEQMKRWAAPTRSRDPDHELPTRECAAPGYTGPFRYETTAAAPAGIDATLAERGSRYGKFEDHSEVSQAMKKVVFTKRPRETLAADQVEALEMICHKIGRILNGDPDYADSWVDIAGYAKLVADRLEGVSK